MASNPRLDLVVDLLEIEETKKSNIASLNSKRFVERR